MVASTPGRDLPLLTGEVTDRLTGCVRTETGPEMGTETGTEAGGGAGVLAEWPHRSQ